MAAWIAYYCKEDPSINMLVQLFQVNEDKLFLKTPAEKPSFELKFPNKLSKKTLLLVIKKIFATMRHLLYKEIRRIQRTRGTQTALSDSSTSFGGSKYYLTKNEVRKILEEIDTA